MAYTLMKRIIERGLLNPGGFDKEGTMDKLDAFLTADRMSSEEYTELVKMMGGIEE